METKIKKKLVAELTRMGDKKLFSHNQFPIIKELRKVLSTEFPGVEFDSTLSDKKGNRGVAWDNILKYSKLDRIDFFLPGYSYSTSDGQKVPVWSRGYQHPTVGSIIHHRQSDKMTLTYAEMATIIDTHL